MSWPEIPDHVAELRDRVRAFVREVCIPAEQRLGSEASDELRVELQQAAREAGVFAPHVPRELGGHGLDIRGWTAVFEAAGYSLLGPLALNCAAPDEGNMHLLELVADQRQRERYLAPLARGEVRSCFAMTEPHPGAGSDPSMLQTTARRVDGGWAIDGRKIFITGAHGAAFAIVMARTGDGEATMFIVDADNPGMRIVRSVETIDSTFVGGHGEVVFENCQVGDEAVLGAVGRGFQQAQARLAPGRLTHCMRWLGIAQRALDVALDYAAEREAFGARLEQLGMAQAMIADSVIDLEASRALVYRAAAALDAGERAMHESSVAKVFVAEAVGRVVDRAVQICGGRGVSADLPVARFMREVRPFRIYDGPSEVHRWSLARRAARRRAKERESDERAAVH